MDSELVIIRYLFANLSTLGDFQWLRELDSHKATGNYIKKMNEEKRKQYLKEYNRKSETKLKWKQ